MTEFTKIIPVSCLQGSGFVLPAEFRDAVVKDTGAYTLQAEDGKQWPCTITRKQQGSHVRADITGGWRPFAHAVGLQAGDEISMKHLGGGVLQVTKTGRTGTPATRTPHGKSAAKTPARKSAKAKTPASGGKATKSASKTPGTTGGGVAKRRGSSSTTKRRSSAAATAAAPEIAPEPAGEEGPLPEYVPPPPEAGYMQPIWPTWCAIM